MTFQEFRRKLILISKLAHAAYWQGRERTHDYLINRAFLLCEEYPEHADTCESIGISTQIH